MSGIIWLLLFMLLMVGLNTQIVPNWGVLLIVLILNAWSYLSGWMQKSESLPTKEN